MKKLLFVFMLSVLMIGAAWGQTLLLTDDFTGEVGTLLTENGWTAHSGGGSTPMSIASPGLVYPGYLGSDIGNATSASVNGEDVNRSFTAVTSGSIYYSFLVNSAMTAPAGYIAHFMQANTIFYARFWVRIDSGNLNFGLAKTTAAATWDPTNYSLNTTYLIVLKYTFNDGATNNDAVYMYVNPVLGGAEPTPTLSITNDTAQDATSISMIGLRQYNTGQLARFDGIRVGTTWADIAGTGVGNLPPVITNVSHTPVTDITSATTVSVSATVTDDSAVETVQLKWGTSTGNYPTTINMTASGSTYTTVTNIPAQVNGTTVYYVIFAVDDDSDSATSTERSYIVRDPATTTIPYTQDFDAGWGDVYTTSVSGTRPWYIFNNDKASCNGYGGTLEEHWLVLPGINFNNYTNERMTFNTIATYGAIDVNNYLKLMYSANYSGMGDPTSATWIELPFANGGIGGGETPSGVLDLSAISGTNVYIAFKYYSTNNSTRWEIDDINIYSGGIPTITVSTPSLTGFTYVLDNGPSQEQSFTVSGADLERSITLTPPLNFEISTSSGENFVASSSIRLNQTGGSVAPTTIFARMAAGLAVDSYSGIITITSSPATAREVSLSGAVTSPPPPDAPVANPATSVTENGFTANWNASATATGYYLDVYAMDAALATNLLISEYVEGTSYRKGIEIYNGTGASVDLSAYSLKKQTNGAGDFGNELVLSGALANNDIYVIAYTSASAGDYITGAMVDLYTSSGALNFNGNDAVALYHNSIQIDVVGIVNQVSPSWGADVTLVRKATVTSPTPAYSIDDWDVYPVNTLDYLGSHTMGSMTFVTGYENYDTGNVTQKAISGLNPETVYNYVVRAYNTYGTSDDSNQITVQTLEAAVAPNAPVAIAATEIGINSFKANWNASAGTASYRLDVSTENNFASYVPDYYDLTVFGTNQIVNGLAANTSYYYRVRAVNIYGTSENSNTISATTLIDDPFGGYYNPVAGLTGPALRSGLQTITSTGHTNNTWDNTRYHIYATLDNVDNTVTCVYTNQEFAHPAGGNYTPDGLSAEHTYPREWFTGHAEYNWMDTDLHALFPATQPSNSARSNYPYDYVTSITSTWGSGNYFSYGGLNANANNAFEVADQFKGDAARALLYMGMRYYADDANFTQGNVNLIPILLQWHTMDPVDAYETNRNEGIYVFQGNRNPFVDNPAWITSIWGSVAIDAPVAILPTNVAEHGFTANWEAVTGAASYRLDVSTSSSFAGYVDGFKNKVVNGTSQALAALDPATTYYYRVRAIGSNGELSLSSNTIFATTTVGGSVVYYWNFNENDPGTGIDWDQNIASQIGSGNITYNFTAARSFVGTTLNGEAGEVNGGSFCPRGGVDALENNGNYFEMAMPTTGLQNLVLTYATRRTSTGFTSQQFLYTTDGTNYQEKVTFTDLQIDSWLVRTVDFSGIAAVNNNPNFKIRVVLAGATTAAGNNRFDNIKVFGTPVGGGVLDPPENVQITHDGTNVTISWDSVTGATGYRVYASDEPYTWGTAYTPVGTDSLVLPAAAAKKFYRVTAVQ